MRNEQHKQPAPDWAPDGCPADVVDLVADDQFLQDLKLRGLASSESKEIRNAVRTLRGHLAAQLEAGIAYGRIRGGILGLGIGIALGAFAMWAAL